MNKADTVLNLDEMYELAYKLWEQNSESWGPMSPDDGRNYLLYMVEEIGEVIAILKKKKTSGIMEEPLVRERFVEELCDVMMYYVDLLHRYKITPEEFSTAYRAKYETNMNRDYQNQYKEFITKEREG